MRNINAFIAAAVALVVLAGCSGSGYKKTSSGLTYKIVAEGKGPAAKTGDIIKLHFTQKVNDSVLGTSYGKMPAYQRVDSAEGKYMPEEVFRFVHKGDSVIVVQMVDTLLKKFPMGLPPYMKKGDKITTALRIVDVFTSEDLAKADAESEMAKEKIRQEKETASKSTEQLKEMETYLSKNNIQAQKTGKGTFVTIKDPGNGALADSGKYVTVKYTGKSLADNKVFESNMDGSRPPFSFVVGTGNVIPGWDEGLKLLKKGGKATLYIPGFLAYGPNPGPSGKTYESLIFDVELVDVANQAPPQPQMPPMPQGQGQPGGR